MGREKGKKVSALTPACSPPARAARRHTPGCRGALSLGLVKQVPQPQEPGGKQGSFALPPPPRRFLSAVPGYSRLCFRLIKQTLQGATYF